ncbi:hypothetical protein BDW22DRAFT_1429301 [Trametopsis cervina]|nr:hypothetical protein BDW22DRAFT_1429301 [Trametopsis cervina]
MLGSSSSSASKLSAGASSPSSSKEDPLRPSSSPATPPPRSPSRYRSTYVFTTRPNTAPGSPQSPKPGDVPRVPVYPSVFKQPFADPLRVLCEAFNLRKLSIALHTTDAVPSTVDMLLLDRTSCDCVPPPTHALVVLDTARTTEAKGTQSIVHPIIVPFNFTIFEQAFNSDLLRHHRPRPATSGSPLTQSTPLDAWGAQRDSDVVRLPTITARVPHPRSLPLLILFGLAPYLNLGCSSKCKTEHMPKPKPRPLPPIPHPTLAPPSPVTPSNASSSTLPAVLLSPPPTSPLSPRGPKPLPPIPSIKTSGLLSPPLSPSPPPLSPSPPPSPSPSHTSPSPRRRIDTLPVGLLSTYLLPTAVIEEFPAFPAMASVFARTPLLPSRSSSSSSPSSSSPSSFYTPLPPSPDGTTTNTDPVDALMDAYVIQNQGMWRNALVLAPQDPRIVEIVRTAWNVTAEARKERERMRERGREREAARVERVERERRGRRETRERERRRWGDGDGEETDVG